PLAYRQRWFAPRSVDSLAALRAARPEARLIAGATDIGLWVNKQFRALPELISVAEAPDLARIDDGPEGLHIGAGASLEAAWAALAARWPQLQELWLRFASPPVRHAGTMGGNLANGSPIGDSAPVLMALDAQVQLQRLAQVRTLPLADFYTGYMSNRLERGEFLRGVLVPPQPAGRAMRAYKVSKRFDSDISALCAGLAVDLDGDRVVSARLTFGGMAATVKRAARAEAALAGRPWDETALREAQAALAQDFAPLTDLRASAGYRLQVAQNLLRRFWLETRTQSPLSESDTRVWSRAPVASQEKTA
ncbi:MAG: FAD binding domain-containing protein, partial [Rubrivivax sp.]|nr:FAD binding domain-containing protein [Rubrivivax sp.]